MTSVCTTRNRERFNELLASDDGNGAKAAALFYYLNRPGYNGLCRFNQNGRFNVPFGRYTQIGYATDFSEYRRAFANWTFMSRDFESLLVKPGEGASGCSRRYAESYRRANPFRCSSGILRAQPPGGMCRSRLTVSNFTAGVRVSRTAAGAFCRAHR
jgi:hypothetical protein